MRAVERVAVLLALLAALAPARRVQGAARPPDTSTLTSTFDRSTSGTEVGAQPVESDDPDQLYAHREHLPSARKAADLWERRAITDFDAGWKLARACYWLGTRGEQKERRPALERGVKAGEAAVKLAGDRPEGHFWLGANMGRLAESFGMSQGLKYRGRIKEELERVIALQPGWQNGSAEAALGQWYFKVPRLFGGSRAKAEQYLRLALTYHPDSHLALSDLAEVVAAAGRRDEAATLLRRVIAAPIDPEWTPEDTELQKKAEERLKTLGR